MDIMIEKVIMFAIIITVSFIAAKAGWLNDNVREGLSKLIIKITAPLMIFTSFASLEFKVSLLIESGKIVIIAFTIVSLLILIGKLYAKKAKLDEKTRGVQIALMSFGNVAFLAYPLFEAVFGAIGVFYGAFYHLANDTYFWTVGVSQIDYKNKQSRKERLIKLVNQNMVAIILGIIAFLFQFRFPPVIFEPLVGLGRTTVYLSLVFIGTTMATVDIRKTYKKLSIYAVVIIKMIIMPAIVAFILTKVYSFGLTEIAISAIVLQVSMPCMIIVAIMANELEGNYKYASETVFVTTLISLVTMPMILKLIEYLLY